MISLKEYIPLITLLIPYVHLTHLRFALWTEWTEPERREGEVNEREASGPVPVTHILTLSGRSLQSQPFHRESFYVTGTPPLYVPLSLPHLTPFLPRYGSSFTPFMRKTWERTERAAYERNGRWMTRAASVPWSVLRPFHSLTPAARTRSARSSRPACLRRVC